MRQGGPSRGSGSPDPRGAGCEAPGLLTPVAPDALEQRRIESHVAGFAAVAVHNNRFDILQRRGAGIALHLDIAETMIGEARREALACGVAAQDEAVGAFGAAQIGLVGGAIGAAAGYVGGWWDEILMRMTDVLLSFPYIVLAIALAAAVGSGLGNVILIIAVLRLPHFARIARGAVLTIKHLDYVLAARTLGQEQGRGSCHDAGEQSRHHCAINQRACMCN